MIVLDTNVISEPLRPSPSPAVLAWLNAQAPDALFTTTLNLAELYAGVAVLPAGKRRSDLAGGLRATLGRLFAGRILAFDVAAAESFAVIAERSRASGLTMPHEDALIAAIAASQGFAVATRNVGDFAGAGVTVINPWEYAGDLLSEPRIREIVKAEIGEVYVFVIASAISRYLTAADRWSSADDDELADLCRRAKTLFDQHEDVFSGSTRMPVGARREIICRHLQGEDVRPLLAR